jgi:ACS family hexuronate transporter-like MFS transporter
MGTVFGLVAAGSGLGGMLSTNLVARVVTKYSYTPIFIIMGLLHPIAWFLSASLKNRTISKFGAGREDC